MSERVLVLTSTFPQFEGDPRGTFIRQHWEAIATEGARVRVLAPRTAWSRDDLDTPLEIHRFRYAPRDWSVLTGRFGILENVRERAWRALLLPAYGLASARALREQLRDYGPDRVVAHMFLPSGWTVAAACSEAGVPFELFGHGTDVDVMLRLPGPLRRRFFAWAERARAVYVPSREKLGRLRSALGVDVLPAHFGVEAMVHATPIPSSAPAAARTAGERRLLFVGRLIAQKGVDDLLHAASMLPGCVVDIAGEGPQRRRLEQLARQLGIDVAFHGFVTGESKWNLFRGADVLCVPSRDHGSLSEGAPLVIEEARAVGLPIVAAATGGIPELCEGREDAVLVPAGDPGRFAAAIEGLLARRDLRRTG